MRNDMKPTENSQEKAKTKHGHAQHTGHFGTRSRSRSRSQTKRCYHTQELDSTLLMYSWTQAHGHAQHVIELVRSYTHVELYTC